MPRRQFIQDLGKAQSGVLPAGIFNLRPGDDDGYIQFAYAPTVANGTLQAKPLDITAMIPDLSEYPKSHYYMVFVDDDAPPHMSNALRDLRAREKTVFELVDIVSATLDRVQPDGDGDAPTSLGKAIAEDDSETDELEATDDDKDDEMFGFAEASTRRVPELASDVDLPATVSDVSFRNRIRTDLRHTKAAGFKVGLISNLLEGGNAFVTVAIRVAKLKISAEAMQAWQISPDEYLIMIIRYPNGYKNHEELLDLKDSKQLSSHINFRVVIGKQYKPTFLEALEAFRTTKEQTTGKQDDSSTSVSSVHDTFISKPLSRLLEEHLVKILYLRQAAKLPWLGAEKRLADHLDGLITSDVADKIPDSYYRDEQSSLTMPKILLADHCAASIDARAFPLLAMQFMLRHFARCTEFCLVCHRKLDNDIQAIKPYVCDRPLCLYQYMNLGFGPSIEHEISSQPYVVDLLISLCYSSASAGKLKDLPDGLDFRVPPGRYQSSNTSDASSVDASAHTKDAFPISREYEVGYDANALELLFADRTKPCPVRENDWIVLNGIPLEGEGNIETHCRVRDASLYPTIYIDPPIPVERRDSLADKPHVRSSKSTSAYDEKNEDTTRQSAGIVESSGWVSVRFEIYSQEFDGLASREDKLLAICRLLDTMPAILDMQAYVRRNKLERWVERISPHALKLLRWVIASNRACIMQVDGNSKNARGVDIINTTERVSGMDGYVQFRFSMGAPDKERRFIDEVRRTKQRLNLQYPTIFAFHGSPLANWHMIIREGLHYQRADHGRAYGDGVYHAKDATTSTSYSGGLGPGASSRKWPRSLLGISSVLALSEIVNAPAEFTSQQPYYVIQHLDWIQTRYLFVSCRPDAEDLQNLVQAAPAKAHPQDPQRTPQGSGRKALIIPASAIKSSRAVDHNTSRVSVRSPAKKRRINFFDGSPAKRNIVIDSDGHSDSDGAQSIATDTEDLAMLCDEEVKPVALPTSPTGTRTDFEPGKLDFVKLPMLPMPTYATSGTTKRLMHELQSLQKVQSSTPLADLGWFIDMDRIENPYQWIVELHSFHTFDRSGGDRLPLVDDMKKFGLTSIVLETRFSKDFPFAPPYIRVVRPRFKTLSEGGGGHVVMGGALCMELLTNNGWVAASSMESVLMQVRMAIASEPYARLAQNATSDYGAAEGADGYIRACSAHGWQVPPGFKEMAYGVAPPVKNVAH